MSKYWYFQTLAAAQRHHSHEPVHVHEPVHHHVECAPPREISVSVSRERGEEMSDRSSGWMLVLLLMMGSVTLTVLAFIILFVTGLIGGNSGGVIP